MSTSRAAGKAGSEIVEVALTPVFTRNNGQNKGW